MVEIGNRAKRCQIMPDSSLSCQIIATYPCLYLTKTSLIMLNLRHNFTPHNFTSFDMIFHVLKGTRAVNTNTYTSALDTAAQNLNPSRQSNRVSGIPLSFNSSRGVTNIPKIKAQEYPSVVVLLMVLLGMKSLYLPREQTWAVQYALVGLYLMWIVLKRTWYNRQELHKLPGILSK